jgi:hypothetical protein
MGKLAIFVLGVVIGSTWLTSHQAGSTTVCADSARSSQSAPVRSEPDDQHDYLDKIRNVGGELWQRIVRPMLASAASHTLDALIDLLRTVADNSSGEARSHASLDRKAPAASMTERAAPP